MPPDEQATVVLDKDLRTVMLPSGAPFDIHTTEVGYFNERVRKYTSEHVFTNVSDLQDLDKIVMMETLMWRWGQWIARGGVDYWSEAVDEDDLQKAMKSHSIEVRQMKAQLGVDKRSRDRKKGDDSVAEYIKNLQERAQELGIVRNTTVDVIIGLGKDLKSLIGLHDRADEKERMELRCTSDDILQWIREAFIPEMEKADEDWRAGSQKLWIQQM